MVILKTETEQLCKRGLPYNRQIEFTPWKYVGCGSEDHMIAKCTKQVCFNEKVNRACDNGKSNSDCKIYASMARVSSNDEWKNHGKTEN